MSYDNQIIRDIADVANRKTPRKLAIADSQKVKNISLSTLEVTADEMGLYFSRVEGIGEDGEPCEFLIVAAEADVKNQWELELAYTNLFGTNGQQRLAMQIDMGKALGYDASDILAFIKSDVSATCPCTCCGGEPQ